MTEKQIIDSGILQYVPKGSYYEGSDEQFDRVFHMWQNLFDFDRTLFSLTTLLGGTRFSKGMMSHMILSNPVSQGSGRDLVVDGLDLDFEKKILYHNLERETTPNALKNLLILAGSEGDKAKRINNSRTRKVILEYLFNRPQKDTDYMSVNYKGKMKMLVRHALGKQDLHKILNGDNELFQRFIGRYQSGAQRVLIHLFNSDGKAWEGKLMYHYPMIEKYRELRQSAIDGNVDEFKKLMNDMPVRTVMGFRNTFKLPIELSDIYSKTKMGAKEALQMQSATKKAGAKVKVNYNKQDIYDLWKYFYFKILNGEGDDLDKINEAIEKQSKRMSRIDIGECAVICDASHSMFGSDKRPMHPFLTSLSIISVLDNVKEVIYVGGAVVKEGSYEVIAPAGETALWRGLIDAVLTGVKKIVVLSDGFENTIKGMFDEVYKHFKNSGYEFEILHINPVFSASAKSGTGRKLTEDVKPMPVENYKYVETELIFNRMIENTEMVKRLLVNKYKKLIGG